MQVQICDQNITGSSITALVFTASHLMYVICVDQFGIKLKIMNL